jgi:asparagine synthetase B (glutamine-hydrolysing)
MYVQGNNIFAHERLAIVDVENGAQPLFNEVSIRFLVFVVTRIQMIGLRTL